MLPDSPRSSALPVLVVAAALIDRAERVLVQRRPRQAQHGGLWEFPGGKVEPGETLAAALVRELAEELGIVVAPEACQPAGFVDAPPIVLLLYACRAWTGEPVAGAGAALRWVDRAALAGLAMPPGDQALLGALAPR